MRGKVRIAAVLAAALVVLAGTPSQAGTIAFFGTGTGADPDLITHLESAGHTVTSLSPTSTDGTSQVSLANASDLVIISESIGSANVSSPQGVFHLMDVITPIISFEAFMFEEAKWTGLVSYQDFGNTGRWEVPEELQATQKNIYIVDPVHPMAGGLGSGAVQVFNTDFSVNFGIVGPQADVVATADEGGNYPTIFIYEAGTTLADGTTSTPGRRIGMFLGQGGDGLDFANITAAGLALFDAGVDYALESKEYPLGDVNRDCRVNILDLVAVRNKLNQDPATGGNRLADVNEDSRINILDLMVIRNNLNARCE